MRGRVKWVAILLQKLCLEIGMAEVVISQIKSLEAKLGSDKEVRELIWKLVSDSETTLPDAGSSPIAPKLRYLFCETQKVRIRKRKSI